MLRFNGSLALSGLGSGDSGQDSTQLLLSGPYNSGVNNGSTEGTYKLKIEGYNNDGSLIVYPIYLEDENNLVDFYIRNTDLANNIPAIGYFRGRVGIANENPITKLDIGGTDDVNENDGTGLIQTGTTGGFNIGIDDNEIQARNDSVASRLILQREGGTLQIGAAGVPTGYSASIDGKLACEEVLVDLSGDWPDYVFIDDYELNSLDEVKNHIQTKGHLPGVPSAQQVEEKGIQLGEMNKILIEKIEELTLYILQQEERIKALEEDNK